MANWFSVFYLQFKEATGCPKFLLTCIFSLSQVEKGEHSGRIYSNPQSQTPVPLVNEKGKLDEKSTAGKSVPAYSSHSAFCINRRIPTTAFLCKGEASGSIAYPAGAPLVAAGELGYL